MIFCPVPQSAYLSGWVHASIAGGMGSIPGQESKIPHSTCHAAKINKAMSSDILPYESIF